MPHKLINSNLVTRLYRLTIDPITQQGSCRKVAEMLEAMEIVNPNTGKRVSRQAVRQAMLLTEEGRDLLGHTAHHKWYSKGRERA